MVCKGAVSTTSAISVLYSRLISASVWPCRVKCVMCQCVWFLLGVDCPLARPSMAVTHTRISSIPASLLGVYPRRERDQKHWNLTSLSPHCGPHSCSFRGPSSALHQGSMTYSWTGIVKLGFPRGSDDKESACDAGDLGSIPGSGRSPGEGNGYLLQSSCLENSVDSGAWWAAVHGLQRVRHDWVANTWASLMAQIVKNLLVFQEIQVQSLGF